ncbi:MAG: radical SAM protein, partial [Thermoplasmataceae archaeon]
MKIIEIEVKHALHDSGLPEMGFSINPYLGCQHRCLYCFAIDFTNNREAREHWGQVVVVKKNFVDALVKDIKNVPRKVVGVSTITDPYQPVEAKYRITGKSLEVLLGNGFRVSVQTKSPLVLRDLELIKRYRNRADVGMTITHPDPARSVLLETQTP